MFSRQLSQDITEDPEDTHVELTITKSEEVGVFSESVNRCQWSRNGLHFAAGGGEGVLSVYNFDPEAVKAELFASYSCGNDILALDWSYPTGNASSELLLYGMQGGGLGIFNMATSDILRELTVESASAVVDVAFAPTMSSFAAATLNATTPLSLWDVATSKTLLDTATMGVMRINCLEYLPSGFGVYCGCADGCVRLFDVRSGKTASEDRVCNDAISGLQLAAASSSGLPTLFCCSTDGLLREFDARNMRTISCYLFPPDP